MTTLRAKEYYLSRDNVHDVLQRYPDRSTRLIIRRFHIKRTENRARFTVIRYNNHIRLKKYQGV